LCRILEDILEEMLSACCVRIKLATSNFFLGPVEVGHIHLYFHRGRLGYSGMALQMSGKKASSSWLQHCLDVNFLILSDKVVLAYWVL